MSTNDKPTHDAHEKIKAGYQAFVTDGDEEFGAVRDVTRDGITVYVENAGEFVIGHEAVAKVVAQKVIFDCAKLEKHVREAIGHAHEAEQPGL